MSDPAKIPLTLRPMAAAEVESTVESAFAHFVEELLAAGQIGPDEVAARIRREREQHLPDGVATEFMLLFIAEVDGVRVGWLWLALPGAPYHADTAWVYNVEVDEPYRGSGYGQAMMLAAEQELVHRGVSKLGLNVFGANRTAIRLYERLGYQVLTQQMSKTLGD